MISITLSPAEFTAVEFPGDVTVKSLRLRVEAPTPHARCLVIADVQTSTDGLAWSSPVAQARLEAEERALPLTLKEGVRKLRVTLHNVSEKSVSVQVCDPMDSEVEAPATTAPEAVAEV